MPRHVELISVIELGCHGSFHLDKKGARQEKNMKSLLPYNSLVVNEFPNPP